MSSLFLLFFYSSPSFFTNREALRAEGEERRSELDKKTKELEQSFREDTSRLKDVIKKAGKSQLLPICHR